MAKRNSRSSATETSAAPTETSKRTRAARARATAGEPVGAPEKRLTGRTADQPSTGAIAAGPAGDAVAAADPSDEDIRQRAYLRFLQRGATHGADFDDWLEAERELRAKR